MANPRQFAVIEAQNLQLGQQGAIFEDGTTAVTSKKIIGIYFLVDTTFTTLTPSSSAYIGTSGGNGDAVDSSNTFPKGTTIYGQWTAFTLASGAVVAYQGTF
tara:strand:+ start:1964 stop:2269 length:306 start_codon:yes stop_codon:yes gene_type:complete